MKILFHTNTLNYRGTSVALRDYAFYNQEILGNESIIAYCKTNGNEKDMGNEYSVIEELEKTFQVVGYRQGDLEKKIDTHNIDLCYMIESGQRTYYPTNCKSGIHAVFQFNEPYGDVYAYVSEWLSQTMSGGKLPYVPHIVHLPDPTKNFRSHLGIRDDQIVIGRIGGYLTFDIPFVKSLIQELVTSTDQFVFLFVGTEPFIEHKNVIFINEIHDQTKKSNFINTCDAMLHARQRGESFGLAIAEFLYFNKPVFAWNQGHDKNHLTMVNPISLYSTKDDLKEKLFKTKAIAKSIDWKQSVEQFTPDKVMVKFNEVFIQ